MVSPKSELPFVPAEGPGRDPWAPLAVHTRARIALGRSGGSLRSADLLDFRLSHARARDAVWIDFDCNPVLDTLAALGQPVHRLRSAATDRGEYLRRPDLGRTLAASSATQLSELATKAPACDLVLVLSDGLSSLAATRQLPPVLTALIPLLRREGYATLQVCLVPFARVKLQDEIGSLLGARQSLMLLGERPGLGSPDSLGAYLTWNPAPERHDADRNCVSNIRPDGLPPAEAALKLTRLLLASRQRQHSGVALKDDDTLPKLSA